MVVNFQQNAGDTGLALKNQSGIQNGYIIQTPCMVYSSIQGAESCDPYKDNGGYPILVEDQSYMTGLVKQVPLYHNVQNTFCCNVCGINFYSEKYYIMHLNSKKHIQKNLCLGNKVEEYEPTNVETESAKCAECANEKFSVQVGPVPVNVYPQVRQIQQFPTAPSIYCVTRPGNGNVYPQTASMYSAFDYSALNSSICVPRNVYPPVYYQSGGPGEYGVPIIYTPVPQQHFPLAYYNDCNYTYETYQGGHLGGYANKIRRQNGRRFEKRTKAGTQQQQLLNNISENCSEKDPKIEIKGQNVAKLEMWKNKKNDDKETMEAQQAEGTRTNETQATNKCTKLWCDESSDSEKISIESLCMEDNECGADETEFSAESGGERNLELSADCSNEQKENREPLPLEYEKNIRHAERRNTAAAQKGTPYQNQTNNFDTQKPVCAESYTCCPQAAVSKRKPVPSAAPKNNMQRPVPRDQCLHCNRIAKQRLQPHSYDQVALKKSQSCKKQSPSRFSAPTSHQTQLRSFPSTLQQSQSSASVTSQQNGNGKQAALIVKNGPVKDNANKKVFYRRQFVNSNRKYKH